MGCGRGKGGGDGDGMKVNGQKRATRARDAPSLGPHLLLDTPCRFGLPNATAQIETVVVKILR